MYLLVQYEERTGTFFNYWSNSTDELVDTMIDNWSYGDCELSLYHTEMTDGPNETREMIEDETRVPIREVDVLVERLSEIGMGWYHDTDLDKAQADEIWEDFRNSLKCAAECSHN